MVIPSKINFVFPLKIFIFESNEHKKMFLLNVSLSEASLIVLTSKPVSTNRIKQSCILGKHKYAREKMFKIFEQITSV